MSRARRLPLGALVLGVGFGAAAESAAGWSTGDFVVGCVLLGCGSLAWWKRDDSRSGPLLMLTGFVWFLGTVSDAAVYLHRAALVQVVVAYPSGRLGGRLVQAFVVCAYVVVLAEPHVAGDDLTVALAGGLLVFACVALTRGRFAPAAAAAALAGAFAFTVANRWAALGERDLALAVYDGVVAGVALGLTFDLLRPRRVEAAVRGLVVDLGSISGTAGLRDRLAKTLGDSSLALGYRLKETGALVDDAGHPLELPAAGSGRAVTRLERNGEEIGVLVHDAAVLSDPELIGPVAAAAQLAMANAELHAEARESAAELAASRRRIVESSDRERRRLALELQQGPERLLEDAAAHLALAGTSTDQLAPLQRALAEARHELRELASGIRPAVLSEGGLAPAVAQLAERSPIPVRTQGRIARLPEAVEAALFFVCSEALANAVKHSHAEHVTVELGQGDGWAGLAVADDGIGGAVTGAGSGLAGLADRVEALGGTLRLDSKRGAGTRLAVEVPVSPPASTALR